MSLFGPAGETGSFCVGSYTRIAVLRLVCILVHIFLDLGRLICDTVFAKGEGRANLIVNGRFDGAVQTAAGDCRSDRDR